MSHYKNSVREKAMGKKWICYDSERKALFRVWAIAKGKGFSQGMGLARFWELGEFMCQ